MILIRGLLKQIMYRFNRLSLCEHGEVWLASELGADQVKDKLKSILDLWMGPPMEKEITETVKYLVLELASLHLDSVKYLFHHVAIL